MDALRVIMIGDVVGNPGLDVLEKLLPPLIREERAAFVVVNGENAADGFGITDTTLGRILAAGADVVTSGNHVWEKREFWPLLDSEERILRPANYPGDAPGRGWVLIRKNEVPYLVINLQGRELMTPIDCPFKAFDSVIENQGTPRPIPGIDPAEIPAGAIVLVDFHAESTKEKEALGFYLDGRAAVAVGTHTHVQTADAKVLPGGTGYITDLGMTGVSGGVIGMDAQICMDRVRTQVLYRMTCAEPSADHVPTIQGIIAEIDWEKGRTLSMRRLQVSKT
jgi:metallophosphoesterase (TIGR00282 family)